MKFRDMFKSTEMEFGKVNKAYKEFIKLDTLYRKLDYMSIRVQNLKKLQENEMIIKTAINHLYCIAEEYVYQYQKYFDIKGYLRERMYSIYNVKWEEKYDNWHESCKQYLINGEGDNK